MDGQDCGCESWKRPPRSDSLQLCWGQGQVSQWNRNYLTWAPWEQAQILLLDQPLSCEISSMIGEESRAWPPVALLGEGGVTAPTPKEAVDWIIWGLSPASSISLSKNKKNSEVRVSEFYRLRKAIF